MLPQSSTMKRPFASRIAAPELVYVRNLLLRCSHSLAHTATLAPVRPPDRLPVYNRRVLKAIVIHDKISYSASNEIQQLPIIATFYASGRWYLAIQS